MTPRGALESGFQIAPPRPQPLVANARTHAEKRERPGLEARAFTLNLLTRQNHDGGHGTPSASSASNRA
jgi:hypothetical protein